MQPLLTSRFEEALIYATRLHATQVRKGSGVPYLSHLLAVAGLVLEASGNEDEAIAALLHDGPEDQGGEQTLADIEQRFGPQVASIVAACSDTFEDPKPPWQQRKQDYIKHLRKAPPSVLLVSCADKLHNLRTILSDYRQFGDDLWDRFNAGPEDILWYYDEMSDIFSHRGPSPMSEELDLLVDVLNSVISESNALGPRASARQEPSQALSGQIYTLKIKLAVSIYAKDPWEVVIAMDGSTTLEHLHHLIQDAVGFENDHLYEFYIARTWRSGDRIRFDDENQGLYTGRVADIFPLPKDRCLFYLFDYGDSWTFQVSRTRHKLFDVPADQAHDYPQLISLTGRRPAQYPDAEE